MIWRWMLAVVLLLATLWFAEMAAGNIWAAGTVPGPNFTNRDEQIYLHRATVFLSLFGVSFISLVALVVMNIRKIIKKRKEKSPA
jgi:hypothetical protein